METNPNEINYFAKTNFRNQEKKFGIKLDDRRRHIYIIGKTGMGKTELEKNMIIQDIQAGHGVAYVDPHGDPVEEILEVIPSERINDIIYFNPADLEYPMAFNILENVNPEYEHLVADGLMGVFTKIWANLWSARMEHILRNCVLALLESPGNTLLGIMRLLVDKDFRKKIVDKLQNPVVKSFWVDEYANWNDRFRVEAIQAIQNKVGQFLSSGIIRNIVGQPKSTIDARKIMDEGKILLMNLSKGRIGEENSALLGAMMITKVQLAAMSRADTPEKERRDFFLYVDEFQNFATESFADILSEARKYRLNLTLANQYIAQLTTNESTKVRDAVFGNVGTLVVFRVGAADAYFLVKEFEPYFTEEDLVNLDKFNIYLKLMIDGAASRPFSATTLPPLSEGKQNLKNKEKTINVSRERYARPRAEVQEKIIRWLNMEETFQKSATQQQVGGGEVMYAKGVTAEKITEQKKKTGSGEVFKKDSDENKLKAVCDNCGAETFLSFKPQAHLNVFCKNCLKLFKQGKIDVSKLEFHNLGISQNTKKQEAHKPQETQKSQKSTVHKSSRNDLGNQEEPKKEKVEPVNFLAAEEKEKKQEIYLEDLKSDKPKEKGGSGRTVQPGQKIKIH